MGRAGPDEGAAEPAETSGLLLNKPPAAVGAPEAASGFGPNNPPVVAVEVPFAGVVVPDAPLLPKRLPPKRPPDIVDGGTPELAVSGGLARLPNKPPTAGVAIQTMNHSSPMYENATYLLMEQYSVVRSLGVY